MSSRATLSFRVDQKDKDRANDIIEEFAKTKKLNKSESLIMILEMFEASENFDNLANDYVPPNVEEVLNEIGRACRFLKFMEQDFYCLENVAKKKKPDLLNGSPEEVRDMCLACLGFKEEKRIEKVNALRQREYIKRLERFMKGLITISEQGFITDVQFCICGVLDGNLGFSRDGRTMLCPLENNEVVYIAEKCQTMLNPKDGLPPCQYYATIEKLVTLDREFWNTHKLELPALDLEEEELPDPIEEAKGRKVVEAEYKEIEEE